MSLDNSQNRPFYPVDGKVLTTGGSLNVTEGVLAIVNNDNTALTQNGKPVLSSFAGLKKDIQILLGKKDLPITRSTDNKPYASLPFKVSEVVDLKVFAPKQVGVKVDDFIIGFNGTDGTEITLKENSSTDIQLTLCGEPMYHLGYKTGEVTLTVTLQSPYLDDDGNPIPGSLATTQEIVENAVKEFQRMTLLGGAPVTDYVDIIAVNSENDTVTGTGFSFRTLVVPDGGDSNAFALVQAQYPALKVVPQRKGNSTEYTVVVPVATVMADFTITAGGVLPECEECPANFTLTDGVCIADDDLTYSWETGNTCFAQTRDFTITVADDECGSDRLAELEEAYPDLTITIPQVDTDESTAEITLAGTSGTANVVIAGVNYLATFATNLTTTANNFVTAHAANIFAATGATVTARTGVITVTDKTTDFPTLSVANVTTDLAGTVGDADVVVGNQSAACQTTYATTVNTNIVCEECSEEFRALFVAEAPKPFGLVSWVSADEDSSETAKMGIRFRGKEFKILGTEYFRDDMPNVWTSTRLKVAGGQPNFIAESWNSNSPYKVTVLSIAADPEAFGAQLYEEEDMARHYFDGMERLVGNNYGKWLWGQESRLKPDAQYVDYQLTVNPIKGYQYTPHASEQITYRFIVEVGRHVAIETLLNALATEAGVDTVTAFS